MRKNKLFAVSIYGEEKNFERASLRIDKSVRTYSILANSTLEALGCAMNQFRKDSNKAIDCWSVEKIEKEKILRVVDK